MKHKHRRPRTSIYKKYFAPELSKFWEKEVRQPIDRVVTVSSRQNFGDSQVRPLRPFGWMLGRVVLILPVGAVGVVLCLSVVGLPLGIPIMAWIGSWCSKPIRKHPVFDTTRTVDDNIDDSWMYDAE